jgi:hypothetical protein
MSLMSDDELAGFLNERKRDAISVDCMHYPPAKASECHQNVEDYVRGHPGCQAVRGWLVEEFEGFTYFNAHSVVRLENGSLSDITPLNCDCPFIVHRGTEQEFGSLRHGRPRVQYPPIEPRGVTSCAPVEDHDSE